MTFTIEYVNLATRGFVQFALMILVQSSIVTAAVLLAEAALRQRVRATVRYWLVMVAYVHLILFPLLSLPISTKYLPRAQASFAGTNTVEPAGEQSSIETNQQYLRAPDSTWQTAVFASWLAGVCAMAFALIWHAAAARRHIGTAQHANWLMRDILVYCCQRLQIRQTVRLKVSEAGTKPAVSGLLHPVILVPQDLAAKLGSRHLRAVLLHELAHVKRGDLWVSWGQRILHVLYFYNPLLWLADSTIAGLREDAANQVVLPVIAKRDPAYPQLLADAATLRAMPTAMSLSLLT